MVIKTDQVCEFQLHLAKEAHDFVLADGYGQAKVSMDCGIIWKCQQLLLEMQLLLLCFGNKDQLSNELNTS